MVVRTVHEDIAPDAMGFVLAHEHLIARPPAIVSDPDLQLDDEASALDEMGRYRAAGGRAIVEMTTIDYGRDASALGRLQLASGIAIVAATGFNKAKFADSISARHDVSAIATWMVHEVEVGFVAHGTTTLDVVRDSDGGGLRAGLIKASSSLDGPTVAERNVLIAAAHAQRVTGAPISTHTEKGTWALEQARLLLDAGVPPDKILLSHLDLKPDLTYHLEVLSTGVRIGLDQFGKAKYLPDADRLDLVMALAERGFLDRILLSGDMARRSSWHTHGGGPGLVHVPVTIRHALTERGLGGPALTQLFERNAAQWLAFQPRTARANAAPDRQCTTT